jgi:hypothetical protein
MILANFDILFLVLVALAMVPFLVLFGLWLFRRERQRLRSRLLLASDNIPEGLKRPLRKRHSEVRRDWIFIAFYEALLIVAIALFYFAPHVQVWRIRRDLIRSGRTDCGLRRLLSLEATAKR